MNILMMTNTYTPFTGGVERSVKSFSEKYRQAGHTVKIVAPTFEDMPKDEENVIRVPAIQNFNGTDFSVTLPIPGLLSRELSGFRPDIVHSHHPYLIGDTALRVSAKHNAPLVFTFHTFYERYTHYVPADSPALREFVKSLSTGYANLCDLVFSPSQSVARILKERGVQTDVHVVPTGINIPSYSRGDGMKIRKKHGIPDKDYVAGWVSRIAPEKNVLFLSRSLKTFLSKTPDAHFLVVGSGPSREEMQDVFRGTGVEDRVHFTGVLKNQNLIDAYHAMDVFAFASHTETQGIVIEEAMASGIPIVAVDANGIREVVDNEKNGRLIHGDNKENFCEALSEIHDASKEKRKSLSQNALTTAEKYSESACSSKALESYEKLLQSRSRDKNTENSLWDEARRMLQGQAKLFENFSRATGAAIHEMVETE